MRIKYKILLILFGLTLFVSCLGITYSIFNSNTNLTSTNQSIAKFVFNAENLNEIQIPLVDLNPGDLKEYNFSVSNTKEEVLSNVTIEYQMTIKTYHFMPLDIKLYKKGEVEELLLTCDESTSRNLQNEIICVTTVEEISHLSEKLDDYVLKVSFPSNYSNLVYSNLVDFINIEIKSWQKIEN